MPGLYFAKYKRDLRLSPVKCAWIETCDWVTIVSLVCKERERPHAKLQPGNSACNACDVTLNKAKVLTKKEGKPSIMAFISWQNRLEKCKARY